MSLLHDASLEKSALDPFAGDFTPKDQPPVSDGDATSPLSKSVPSRYRNASYMEQFEPAFSAPQRQGTVLSSIFSLVSTILGGGVLSLPYAFSQSGVLLGLLMLLVVAALSDYSIFTLAACSRRGGVHTYEDVCGVAFGPRGRIVSMVMVVSICYLALVAYSILLLRFRPQGALFCSS